MKPQKRKAKTSEPKVAPESRSSSLNEDARTSSISRSRAIELLQSTEIWQPGYTIPALVARIEKGDVDALEVLYHWAACSIDALTLIGNFELLKTFAHGTPVWPVLAGNSGLSPETESFLQKLELGKNIQAFDVRKRKRYKTIWRSWALKLLSFLAYLRYRLRLLSVLELKPKHNAVVTCEGREISVPVDLLEKCRVLPHPFATPPREVVDRYWPVMKELFKLLTDNKFEEIPELRRKVEPYAKRKGLEPGSPKAVSQIRSDILKKFKEAFATFVGARPHQGTSSVHADR